jgi:hypothetical protein
VVEHHGTRSFFSVMVESGKGHRLDQRVGPIAGNECLDRRDRRGERGGLPRYPDSDRRAGLQGRSDTGGLHSAHVTRLPHSLTHALRDPHLLNCCYGGAVVKWSSSRRHVLVNFESGLNWLEPLEAAGFDSHRPAVVTSTGVSMYLTTEAIARTLHLVAALAAGSTFAMTFLVPLELAHPDVRAGLEMAVRGARASGTPFISFFTPRGDAVAGA